MSFSLSVSMDFAGIQKPGNPWGCISIHNSRGSHDWVIKELDSRKWIRGLTRDCDISYTTFHLSNNVSNYS